MEIAWNDDCKEYKGTQPCEVLKAEGYTSCKECDYYDPKEKNILIIKLGAAGDVLRSLPLLFSIKKHHPNSYITWVTKEPHQELLSHHPIDRILTLNYETLQRLEIEKFDILYNLEIDLPATGIATKIKAGKKYGYYLGEEGHPKAYTLGGQYYLSRANSDILNKQNKKTYLEMMHEICEIPYEKHELKIILTKEEKEFSEKYRKHYAIGNEQKLIGINIGSGKRWPGKSWGRKNLISFIKTLKTPIVLLAGPEEGDNAQDKIIERLKGYEYPILKNNPENTLREYMSVVNACDLVITGDTLTMHLALALNKKVIGLFFCTPPWEVDGYERLTTITSPLLLDYFYEDQSTYDPKTIEQLQNSISIEDVKKELDKLF